MLTADAITAWIDHRHQMQVLGLVAASTFKNQSAIAGQLRRALGERPLADMRKSHLDLWLGARRQVASPVTIRGELNVLRQILNWCLDEQLLDKKPRLPTVSVSSTEAALPPDAAFLWVLANVPTQHARALEFMMLTGLSPHELERVQVRDVREVVGSVSDQPQLGIGQRADFAVKQPSRRRWMPLGERARLLWWTAASGLPPTATVFPAGAAVQRAVRRAQASAGAATPSGVAAITPKLMRKWFASQVAPTQPEHVLQRLMGHAPGSPITRRHYVRSTDEQIAVAAAGVRIG